ncbi:MAG: type II secretion system F family protein [Proteobacteria bacterium]|nr:type II secretion system F family protein [Pseudomonadota bacterium]
MSGLIFAAAALFFGLSAAISAFALLRSKSPLAFGRLSRLARAHRGRRRARRADEQLPEALVMLCNALKAGLSLQQAVKLAASELAPPLGEELARIEAEQGAGKDFDSAFASLSERVPTEDASLVTQSVEVLRRTGGNLVQTFSSLAKTIEQRRRVKGRVDSLTAQGRAQAAVLLLLPWGLAAALAVLAPEFMRPMCSTRLGIALMIFALLLEAAGGLWLMRIAAIKV